MSDIALTHQNTSRYWKVKVKPVDAYLDIETTGLACFGGDSITVIGVYVCNGVEERFIQLKDEEITGDALMDALEGVRTIFTYNGERFDLPFIKSALGVDLKEYFQHRDLMYNCWEHNLKGGFKAVECKLGIERETKGITGYHAILLWWRYKNHGSEDALHTLLKYNEEDVRNLKTLRQELVKLGSRC